jgi:hypothetical protein
MQVQDVSGWRISPWWCRKKLILRVVAQDTLEKLEKLDKICEEYTFYSIPLQDCFFYLSVFFSWSPSILGGWVTKGYFGKFLGL